MNICKRSAARGGVLLLAGLLVAAMHSGHELDSDEGVILSGAWHLRHGLLPYTDMFEIVGPGNFYLVYWAWLALGPAYWVAKLAGACAIGLAALGVYRLAQDAVPADTAEQPAVLAALPPLLYCLLSSYWQTINHNTFSLPGAVWSAVFAARALAGGRRRDAAASGLLAGLTALFLQHRAAAVVVAIGLVLLCTARRRHCLPAFAAGVAAGAAPLLCWPVGSILEHLVLFPLQHYADVNRLSPTLLIAYAGAWLCAVWVTWRTANPACTLLLLLQPLLLASTQRADLTHVSQNLFPLVALLPALVAKWPATLGTCAAQVAALLAVLVSPAAVPTALPGRGSDPFLPVVLEAVRTNCADSDYLYAGPFLPNFYFESGKLNPTRHSLLLTGFNTAAQFEATAAALARAAPACALTHYGMVEKFAYNRDNPVDRYLVSHYVPAVKWRRGLVLWRRRDR